MEQPTVLLLPQSYTITSMFKHYVLFFMCMSQIRELSDVFMFALDCSFLIFVIFVFWYFLFCNWYCWISVHATTWQYSFIIVDLGSHYYDSHKNHILMWNIFFNLRHYVFYPSHILQWSNKKYLVPTLFMSSWYWHHLT